MDTTEITEAQPEQLDEMIDRVQQQIMRDRRRDRKQVARAVACCGAVARLYRRYGGAVTFTPLPTSGSVKTDTPVKAPKRGYEIKRTLKGLR